MVRGCGYDSKSSTTKVTISKYDATIKRWSSAWNAIKNFMHVNGKLQHGVAKESINGAALEERLSPTDGAEQAELLLPPQTTSSRPDSAAQWKILTQDEATMRTGRDGQVVMGPLKSEDIIKMIEDGNLDIDGSLIAFCPRGFDTAFWEPFSQEKVLELYNNKNNNNSTNAPEMGPTNVPEMGPTNVPEMGPTNVPKMGSTTGAASDGPGQEKKKQKKKTNKQKKKQKKTTTTKNMMKKMKTMKKTKLMKKRVKMKQDKDKDKDKGADGVT